MGKENLFWIKSKKKIQVIINSLAKRAILFAVKYCIVNKTKIYDENGDHIMDFHIVWRVFAGQLNLGKYEIAPFQGLYLIFGSQHCLSRLYEHIL